MTTFVFNPLGAGFSANADQLTATGFASLGTAQMAAITTTALGGLTSTQAAALPTQFISGLTATQMAAITTTALGGLTSTQADALPTQFISGLTSTQVAAITTTALNGLSATQRASLVATSVLPGFIPATGTPVGNVLFDNLSWNSAASSTPSTTAFAGLSSTHIAVIPATSIAGLTSTQLASVTTTAIAGQTATQAGALSTGYIAGLTSAQAAALSTTFIAGLTSTQARSLSTTFIAGLTTTQIGALTTTALGGLSTTQKSALSIGIENLTYCYKPTSEGVVLGMGAAYSATPARMTSVGYLAAQTVSGSYCAAFGTYAMRSVTVGGNNTAFGCMAMMDASAGGHDNTAVGMATLANITGSYNIGIGGQAGNQTAISGHNNIIIGNEIGLPTLATGNMLNLAGTIYATGLYGTTARKVGIGVTAPAAQLDVDNGGDVLGIRVDRATATATDHIMDFVSNVGGTNTTVAYMEADGDLIKVSDENLKTNITDATPKLADLLQLRVVNYNWRTSPEGKKVLGLIAQEVQQVFPSLVRETPAPTQWVKDPAWTPDPELLIARNRMDMETGVDRMETQEEIDARVEGHRPLIEQVTGPSCLALVRDAFEPILIKAVQELAARVQALEERA